MKYKQPKSKDVFGFWKLLYWSIQDKTRYHRLGTQVQSILLFQMLSKAKYLGKKKKLSKKTQLKRRRSFQD